MAIPHRLRLTGDGNLDGAAEAATNIDVIISHVLAPVQLGVGSMGIGGRTPRAHLVPTATTNSHGPAKPDEHSKALSSCSISAQAASRPASSRPANIWCSAPNDSFEADAFSCRAKLDWRLNEPALHVAEPGCAKRLFQHAGIAPG